MNAAELLVRCLEHEGVRYVFGLPCADEVEHPRGDRQRRARGHPQGVQLAESEKPGACHIEVPEDVAAERTGGVPLSTERARRPSPDRQALQTAARLIEAASFPLIFAGNGVVRGQASPALRALARRHGIPVVHTFIAARGLGVAVVNLIFRDDAFNLTGWKQQGRFGRESRVAFANPDFVTLASAFGARGFRVDAARQLGPILAQALALPGMSIVDVPIDYAANAELAARAGGVPDLGRVGPDRTR
jgi:thiamine pyrophosphate-dependent acetolactate synthase large subunit-like protein